MPDWLAQLLPAIIAAVFAGGGAYYGVRVHLYYMRRDVDALSGRVDRIERHNSIYRGITSNGK